MGWLGLAAAVASGIHDDAYSGNPHRAGFDLSTRNPIYHETFSTKPADDAGGVLFYGALERIERSSCVLGSARSRHSFSISFEGHPNGSCEIT